MLTTVPIRTPAGETILDITAQVREAVRDTVQQTGIESGLCAVIVPHTTAAIMINSMLDSATAEDIIADLRRLVPMRVDFQHQYDTPADAAGHIKAVLIGQSVLLVVENGDLVLGGSQSVLFYEFDGPRERRVQVKVIPG